MIVTGFALYPRNAYAEAPDDQPVSRDAQSMRLPESNIAAKSRKPIYDDIDALPPPSSTLLPPVLQPTPSSPSLPDSTEPRARGPTPTDRLASQVRHARLFLYRRACAAEDGVNRTLDRVFALEQSFTSTVAGLAPPRESGERLMPGLIYVLVAAMAGSILTRRSNVVLRAAVPAALAAGAGAVVLPLTMRNVGDLAWRYEQRVPALAGAHLRTREALEKGWSFARTHTQVGKRVADEKVAAARESVEDWVRKGK